MYSSVENVIWNTDLDFKNSDFAGQTNKNEEVELQAGLLDQKLSYWLRISLFKYWRHLPAGKDPRDKKKYYCTPVFVMTQFLLAVLHIRLFTWFEDKVVCMLCKHRSMMLTSVQIPCYPWEKGRRCNKNFPSKGFIRSLSLARIWWHDGCCVPSPWVFAFFFIAFFIIMNSMAYTLPSRSSICIQTWPLPVKSREWARIDLGVFFKKKEDAAIWIKSLTLVGVG